MHGQQNIKISREYNVFILRVKESSEKGPPSLFNPEYDGNISIRNIGKYSPIDQALHLRVLQLSCHWILTGFL